MADNTKTPLITSDPLSYFAKGVKGDMEERTFVRGTDVLATKTGKGTQFSIHPKFKYSPNYMNYVGDWNVSSSYNVNDVVSVFAQKVGDDPTKSPQELLEEQLNILFGDLGFLVKTYKPYTNPTGDDIEVYVGLYTPPNIPIGSNPGNVNYPIYVPKVIPTPGSYVCVAPVPSLTYFVEIVVGGIFGGDPFGSNIIPSNFVSYARLNLPFDVLSNPPNIPNGIYDFNYLPKYPEDKVIPTHFNKHDVSTASGSYWRYLGAFEGGDDGSSCQCRYH